ncbi:hypothetical protein FLGE108171_10325 [Flavobacterium gelidilacus]|uniref:hypothetical protein n=1 Tax=Flavobacterium gelidilacus TaxID=206041 RepID=UPI00041EDD02|nr:hypothetical protein [Flavobacterium gelidilacus]
MYKNYFLLAFSFLFLTSNAQEQDNHSLITKSVTEYYSLASESIHLHFNKSIYLTNETIWFKGYVIDKKSNGLNYSTTNVYVRILDEDKNEIVSKLFLTSNGIIIGHLELDESYASGTYFIHTYTNFMNNFEEDESSIFPVEIINTKDSPKTNNNNSLDNESISLGIEGGKLVFECDNTVGVQIKDCKGKGVKLNNIKVYDSKNILINQFATNEQGYGKFDILKTKSEQYKIVIEQTNGNIEKNLPIVTTEGISMSVNNYSDENKVFIKIKTNNYTFNKNKDKNYTLVIQKNDKVNLIDFYFKSLSNDIIIDKAGLFKGINIIRILDENNNAVAERTIYNHVKNTSTIVLEKGSIINDTLLMKGQLKDRIANFSISVLPTETISTFEENSITSQLNFNAYLISKLENNSYYFKDFNRKKQFELDLVLLNQITPKYEWNNILTKIPSIKYPFDIGLTIEGTINQTISNKDKYNIVLSSIANGINLTGKIDDKNNFKFENIVAIDSTSFFISILDNKSNYEAFKLNSKVTNNKNRFLKLGHAIITKCTNKSFTPLTEFNADFPYMENTTVLRDVILVDKVEAKLENTTNFLNRAGSQGYKIDQNKSDLYYDVIGFIQSHGFDAKTVGGSVSITSRTSNSFKGTLTPAIFLDDVPLGSLDLLLNMNLSTIDEIYINKRGFGTGMSSPSGTIRIYTKKQFGGIANEKINSKSLTIKDGFQKELPFKNPKYSYYENQAFKKYGTINWIPNLYTNTSGDFEFTIPILNQKSVLVNIQGIDNEGNFYYENIVIDVN